MTPRTASQTAQPTGFTDGVWQADFTATYEALKLNIDAYSGDAGDDGRMVSVSTVVLADAILGDNGPTWDEREAYANGHLLAAAPDLYRQLCYLRDAVAGLDLDGVLPTDLVNRLTLLIRGADIALAEARGNRSDADYLREMDV